MTSRETLVIEHASDLATYRRDVIVFTPGGAEGASGSPLVTAVGIAVTASEVSEVRHRSGRAARVAALLLTGPPGACHSGRRRINRKGRK